MLKPIKFLEKKHRKVSISWFISYKGKKRRVKRIEAWTELFGRMRHLPKP